MAWIHTSGIYWPIAALVAGIFVTAGLARWDHLYERLNKPNWFLDAPRTVLYVFLAGLALRLIWWLLVPPVFFSDTLSYWDLAVRLVETGEYSVVENGYKLFAWRPPGYVFVLAIFIRIFGAATWIPALIAFCAYVLTFFAVLSLATITVGRRSARIAAGIVAFWPSAIGLSVNAATDPLSLLLVTVAVLAFLRSIDSGPKWAILSGVATGCGALVQPTLLTLPALWLVFALMERERMWLILRRSAIGILCAACVVGPWALRNFLTLGTFIPVSTNGGDVFYRANNPKATGGFTINGERDLAKFMYDEGLWNSMGFKWGMEWIVNNPVAFLRIVPQKQGLLLGEDAFGFFYTLNWPTPAQGRTYRILTVTANMWWLGVWVAAVAALLRHRIRLINDSRLCLIILVFLSVVAAHSVFESQSRHHMRVTGLLSVVCALAFMPKEEAIFLKRE